MPISNPSLTLYAPVDAIPQLTSGRNSTGFGSGHEPKYTLDNDPDTWWEPSQFITSSIYYDLGVATSVDAIVFWLHNYNENYQNSKSWRISHSTDDISYTTLSIKDFDVERTSYTPIVIDVLDSGPISARYWRIEFLSFALVPQTIIPEISCLWFMKDFSLPFKHQRPESNKLLYHNNETITRSGCRFASPAGVGRQRVLQRQFIFTHDTDHWNELSDAYKAAKGQNLPIVMQTELGSNEFYALNFDTPLSENRQNFKLYMPQIALRELGHERVVFQDYRLSELAETIAIYRFNQNSNDATDNGNDLVNSGYVDGDYENGKTEQGVTVLRAQAANNLSIASGNAGDFDFGTSDFTIEAWILMRSTLTGSDRSFLAKISFGPTTGWSLTHDGAFKIGLSIGDGAVGLFKSNGQPTNDDLWHLHTVVIDRTAGTSRWYLDGVFLRSDDISAITGNISNAGRPFSLGSQAQSDVIWWDEVCITKRKLSDTEVANRHAGSVNFGTWGM